MKNDHLFNKKNLNSLLAGIIILSAGTTLSAQAFDTDFSDSPIPHQLANHYDEDGPRMKRGGSPNDHEARMEARHKKMAEALGLTEEQQSKLKALKEEKKAVFKSKMQASREKGKALHNYMASDDATEAGALERQREFDSLKAEIGQMKVKSFFEMRSILTPEQRTKMKEIHEKRKAQWKQGDHSEHQRRNGGAGHRGNHGGGQF